VAGFAALHVADHHQTAIKQSETHDPAFAVIESGVFDLEHRPGKDLGRIDEIQVPAFQGHGPFGRIERDLHSLIVHTIKYAVNFFSVRTQKTASARLDRGPGAVPLAGMGRAHNLLQKTGRLRRAAA
jgi:hypothetical protein